MITRVWGVDINQVERNQVVRVHESRWNVNSTTNLKLKLEGVLLARKRGVTSPVHHQVSQRDVSKYHMSLNAGKSVNVSLRIAKRSLSVTENVT